MRGIPIPRRAGACMMIFGNVVDCGEPRADFFKCGRRRRSNRYSRAPIQPRTSTKWDRFKVFRPKFLTEALRRVGDGPRPHSPVLCSKASRGPGRSVMQRSRRVHPPSESTRGGLAVVELAICLPLMVMLTFGAIEAANAIYLKQT